MSHHLTWPPHAFHSNKSIWPAASQSYRQLDGESFVSQGISSAGNLRVPALFCDVDELKYSLTPVPALFMFATLKPCLVGEKLLVLVLYHISLLLDK